MKNNQKHNELSIFTIGHSNHTIDHFIKILVINKIEVVVDVRSNPYSKYASQFNMESLKESLNDKGMKYIFLGQELGGMPKDERFYDHEGYVLYDKIAETDAFKNGIKRILTGIKEYRIALLCGEEEPMNCHRRLLVGKVLSDNGVAMNHIRGDGSIEPEKSVFEKELFMKTKGQKSLFNNEEKKEWKSSQSALPKKRQKNSLES